MNRITADARLLPYRELDDVLELTAMADGLLDDGRTGQNARQTRVGLLRPSIFSRLAAIMPQDRPDCPVMRQKRQNRMLGSWLKSPERPTTIGGERLSRNSRLKSCPLFRPLSMIDGVRHGRNR